MTNQERFLKLVSEVQFKTMDWAKEQSANKLLRRAMRKNAVLILKRLKELAWVQNDLAGKMDVSPQSIN